MKSHKKSFSKPKATKAEIRLSKRLQKEKIQHCCNVSLFGFFPDILIPECKLIIEVDGPIHQRPHVKRNDLRRTKILQSYDYCVIRFTNDQVYKRLDFVVNCIRSFVSKRSSKT